MKSLKNIDIAFEKEYNIDIRLCYHIIYIDKSSGTSILLLLFFYVNHFRFIVYLNQPLYK